MIKDKSKILIEKNGMKIAKQDTNDYTVEFSVYNNQFILPAIINFDMVKLIFDLNPDIYEKSILKKNTLDNVTILSLMKDLYSDLGIPQSYVCMSVDIFRSNNSINFRCNPLKDRTTPLEFRGIPNLYLMPFKNMVFDCKIITNHHVELVCRIKAEDDVEIEPFIEKMLINVVNKIFIRLKQFIENLTFNNTKTI